MVVAVWLLERSLLQQRASRQVPQLSLLYMRHIKVTYVQAAERPMKTAKQEIKRIMEARRVTGKEKEERNQAAIGIRSHLAIEKEEEVHSFLELKNNSLEKCKKNHEIVSVYGDDDETDRFSLGFVEDVTDTHVLLAQIGTDGEYDGFFAIGTEEIFRLDIGGQYEKRIQKLYKIKKQNHPVLTAETDSIIINVLRHAKRNRLVIAAQLYGSGYDDAKGMVSDIGSDVVTIQLLDKYGRSNGTCILDIDTITRLVCDSEQEIAIRLLYENQ